MFRTYNSGSSDQVIFFTGTEIEHTPAFEMKTLFVVGIQPINDIWRMLSDQSIKHIFFGANHSFNPQNSIEWLDWESMIEHFLKINYVCTLDIPVKSIEDFAESILNEYEDFIPQIRVPIPYIKNFNYNTMLKIDDRDFNSTNPGVWCHRLHDLMNSEKFTAWRNYQNDQILK